MTREKRVISIMLTVFMAFTCAFSFSTIDTYAAVKPPQVKSVKAKATSSSRIKISWKKVTGADGYVVYNGKKKVGTTKKTVFINKGLKAQKKYTYRVRAYKKVNAKKVFGKYSKKVSATTKKKTSYPSLATARKEAAAYVNSRRTNAGRDPLPINDKVNAVAQKRAELMWKHKSANETYSGYGDSWDMLDAAGVPNVWCEEETYAKGIKSFGDKMLAAMNANNHGDAGNKWMSSDYTAMGIGYKNGYMSIIFVAQD